MPIAELIRENFPALLINGDDISWMVINNSADMLWGNITWKLINLKMIYFK